jgi:hypothetical protein
VTVSAGGAGVAGPRPLWVDPVAHRGELVRFARFVVAGPAAVDCAIWRGAIGSDGYGRFWVRRDGQARVVRAHRYALAAAQGGRELVGSALHECDNPLCVRVVDPVRVGPEAMLHVVSGSQGQNMARMGRLGRGGGRSVMVLRGESLAGRVARSRALRAAVRCGWDADAVAAALLVGGSDALTLW